MFYLLRVSAVKQSVVLRTAEHDEAIFALNKLLQTARQESEVTQKNVNEQIGALVEEINKRLLDSETKTRDDVESKITKMEFVSFSI